MPDSISPFAQPSDGFEFQKLEGNGCCYLLRKRGLTPDESPIEQEKLDKGRAVLMALRLEAIKNYANKNDLSPEAVEKMTKRVPQVDKNGEPLMEDGKQVLKAELAFQPMFYLDKAQCQEMISIQDSLNSEPYLAANNAIRYRLIHHLEAVTDAKSGRLTVKLSPFANVAEGMRVMDPGTGTKLKIKAVGEVDDQGCYDLTIDTSSLSIKSGAHLLLLKPDGTPDTGVPDWTEGQTRAALLEEQINALYAFMLLERSGAVPGEENEEPEEDGDDDEGKPLLTSESNPSTAQEEETQ